MTPGDIGTITGNRLKFNADQPDEGIFFINTADQTETRIARTQRNKPSELVFLVPPNLPTGVQYGVEVRARLPRTEGIRKGELETVLEVEQVK